MNNEQAVIDSLYAMYVSDGYITEDDIINICTEYDLPLHKIDHVCDKVISMGVLISDRVHQNMERNEPKTDELRDLSPIDYETLYYRCISIYLDMEQVINYMRKILPPQKGEIKKLIVQARSGNAFARKKAIEMHMRTALRITMQYINKTDIPIEDLFSVACIAVIKAVDSYDAYIHNYFSQYVSFAIMLKIDRYIAENELLIKMSINRSDNMEKPVVESLDEIMENGDELFIYSDHDICEEVEKKIIAENIRSGLSLLKPKEMDIIRLRFALKDGKEYTLEEVGKIFGLTAQRIRQLEATALRKLKCRKYMFEFY